MTFYVVLKSSMLQLGVSVVANGGAVEVLQPRNGTRSVASAYSELQWKVLIAKLLQQLIRSSWNSLQRKIRG
jgi:hypothetical protein